MQASFGFTAKGISNEAASILRSSSGQVQMVFKAFKPFGDSLDAVLGAALRNVKGISQMQAANLINAGRGGGSTTSRSGSGKAQSGGFGGYKGTRFSDLLQALTYAYGPHSGYASNLTPYNIQQMINFVESEGVPLPTLSPMAGTFNTNHNETIRAFEAALAEANRRRSARIERQTTTAAQAGLSLSEIISLENSGRAAEINHIIEYRRRLEAMSTGTV